jgi:hypothetical protein
MLSIFKYIPALFKNIIPSQRFTGWTFRTRDKEGYFALKGNHFVFGIENDEGTLKADGGGSLFLADDGEYRSIIGSSGFDYRAGSASLNIGGSVINFSSSFTTTDYTLIVNSYDSSGNPTVHVLGSKLTSGFNITMFFAGTVSYIAIPNR